MRFQMAQQTQPPTQTTVNVAPVRVEDFTDDLASLLRSARTRAEGWLGQRHEITNTLTGIRDTAVNLLAQLETAAGAAENATVEELRKSGTRRGRRERRASAVPGAAKRGPGRPRKIAEGQMPKKRTMSP